jgi:hypothetical protein
MAGFDTFEGALADARLLGKLSLGETCFDAASLDTLTQNGGNRGICQL